MCTHVLMNKNTWDEVPGFCMLQILCPVHWAAGEERMDCCLSTTAITIDKGGRAQHFYSHSSSVPQIASGQNTTKITAVTSGGGTSNPTQPLFPHNLKFPIGITHRTKFYLFNFETQICHLILLEC